MDVLAQIRRRASKFFVVGKGFASLCHRLIAGGSLFAVCQYTEPFLFLLSLGPETGAIRGFCAAAVAEQTLVTAITMTMATKTTAPGPRKWQNQQNRLHHRYDYGNSCCRSSGSRCTPNLMTAATATATTTATTTIADDGYANGDAGDDDQKLHELQLLA